MLMEHQEMPECRLERRLIIGLWLLILVGGGLLVRLIRVDPDRSHLAEFMGLLLLLALALYSGLLFYQLSTVQYGIGPEALHLQQGRGGVSIDLTREVRLYRWRNRWGLGEGLTQDLNVASIQLFPPLSLLRPSTVWVVVGWDLAGEERAVVIRPSPALLLLLRERAVPRWEVEHG